MKYNEDYLKCLEILKDAECGEYTISYILKRDKEMKFIAYDESNTDDIIEATIKENTSICSVPDWDFDLDNYLFADLENRFEIAYMPPMEHCSIWQAIDQEQDNFYHEEGLQRYLKYCKENGIDDSLMRSIGVYDVDIMHLYEETNNGYKVIDEFVINNQAIVLAYNPKSISPYVTWKTNLDRKGGYILGNYFLDYERAQEDFISRSNLLYENEKSSKYRFKKHKSKERLHQYER